MTEYWKCVRWVDAYTNDESWFDLESIPQPKRCEVVSVGALIRRDIEYLVLAQTVADHEDHLTMYTNLIYIPAGAILSEKDIVL